MKITKILCPTDFSEPSFLALDAAEDLARQYSAELIVFYVVSPVPAFPLYATPSLDITEYENERVEAAQKSLDALVEKKIARDITVVKKVGQGIPSEEIDDLSNEEGVDLIVIATHGHTGWKHIVFGSVAEKVIRIADCPVLVIPVPKPENH